MTLPIDAFLDRLFEQVLPTGLHMVRGYGMYAGWERACARVLPVAVAAALATAADTTTGARCEDRALPTLRSAVGDGRARRAPSGPACR